MSLSKAFPDRVSRNKFSDIVECLRDDFGIDMVALLDPSFPRGLDPSGVLANFMWRSGVRFLDPFALWGQTYGRGVVANPDGCDCSAGLVVVRRSSSKLHRKRLAGELA